MEQNEKQSISFLEMRDLMEIKYRCQRCTQVPHKWSRRGRSTLCGSNYVYFCETGCYPLMLEYEQKYRKNGEMNCVCFDKWCPTFMEGNIIWESYPDELLKAWADDDARLRKINCEEREKQKYFTKLPKNPWSSMRSNFKTSDKLEIIILKAEKEDRVKERRNEAKLRKLEIQQMETQARKDAYMLSLIEERKRWKEKGRGMCEICGAGPFDNSRKLCYHRERAHYRKYIDIYECGLEKHGFVCEFRHRDFSAVLSHRKGPKCPVLSSETKKALLTCKCGKQFPTRHRFTRHKAKCNND